MRAPTRRCLTWPSETHEPPAVSIVRLPRPASSRLMWCTAPCSSIGLRSQAALRVRASSLADCCSSDLSWSRVAARIRVIDSALIDALQRVGRPQLGLVLARECVERDQVLLGVLEQPADLRAERLEAREDMAESFAGLVAVFGVEHFSQRGGDQAALIAAAVSASMSLTKCTCTAAKGRRALGRSRA